MYDSTSHMHARVLVPVPGAADPAGLVEEADALEPGLAQVGAGHDAGDPRPDDDDVHLVDDRLSLGRPA